MPGNNQERGGVWRTVHGRRVFIADGESLSEAMRKSGKFKNQDKNKKQKSLSQLNQQYRRVEDKWANAKDVRTKVKYSDLADKISKKREEAADREEKEIKRRSQKSSKSKLTSKGLNSLHQHLDKNIQNWKKQGMSKSDVLDMIKKEGASQDDQLWKLKDIDMDNQELAVREEYEKYIRENWEKKESEKTSKEKELNDRGYTKIGETQHLGRKMDVYESDEDGNEVDWILTDGRKEYEEDPIDVTLTKLEDATRTILEGKGKKDEDDDYNPRGEVDYWLSKGEFDKASKVIKENGLEDEVEDFLEGMKTPGGRSDFRKYLERHPISETKKKGMTVDSQTGRKPITNQKEYETAIEALNYIAKQVNETKDPETKAALEKVMDNYQKDLNEYKKSKRPTSEELRGIKTVKQLHAIADKYGLMPSEVQDMAGLKDRDLFESARQEDEEYKKKFENDVQAAERFLKADEANRPTSNIQSQTFKSKKDYDRQIKSLGKVKEDGTFDLTTLKSKNYESGYQVTFSMTDMDMDDESYTKLVEKFKNHDHGNVDAGKFDGYSEISFNVDDIKKAAKLAYKYNQVSIWDWQNNREISTRGTGKWGDYHPETVSQQVKSQRKDKRARKMNSLKEKLKRNRKEK